MMIQESIESAQIQLTNCAKELLCQINEVWEQLQAEPNGSYAHRFIHLPPCSVSYWNNLEKLDSLLVELSQENIEGLFIPFHEFRHTMNKEGSYVRDFTPNKGKKQNATNNELKKLMDDSNSHIGRDLYSIFKLSKSIVDSNYKLG